MKQYSFLFISFYFIILSSFSLGQHQPFIGYLQYKITPADTSFLPLFPESKMQIYTNDTIVRIETFSPQLGKQITIRHMKLRKAYLLLETPFGKFAIQRDFNKEDTIPFHQDSSKYIIKKKWCKEKILHKKANRLTVQIKGENKPFQWLYLKNYSNQIINAFEHQINGLPVRYHIKTPDVLLAYELVRMTPSIPEKKLFSIPKEFTLISFQDFMNKVTGEN